MLADGTFLACIVLVYILIARVLPTTCLLESVRDSARVLRLGRASAHLGCNLEIGSFFLVLVQLEWWYRSCLLLLARDLL